MNVKHLKIILKWLWLLILIPILTIVLGYFYTERQETSYRAVSSLLIGPGISSPSPDLDSLRSGALLMQTYSELVETEAFRQNIIDDLNLDLTTLELNEIIDIRPIIDTQLVNVVVNYVDPDIAVAIANNVADNMVDLSPSSEYNSFLVNRIQEQTNRLEEDILSSETRLEELYEELENLSDTTREVVLTQRITEEEANLVEANQTLASLYETLQSPFTNQVEVVDRAVQAVERSSELAVILLIALGVGLIISTSLVMLLIFLDSLYVDEQVLKTNPKYPLYLGNIRFNTSVSNSDLRVLTAFVQHQSKQKEFDKFMITGVQNGEHTAYIASELASMLSRTGASVLLIDADFTNNAVAEFFEMETEANLIDTLTSDIVKNVIKPHPKYPNLHVLPSGIGTSDVFFLMASKRLARILEQISESVDYVIILSSSLTSFEEIVALTSWTDSSFVVIQKGKTRIANLNKSLEDLASLGTVVRGIMMVE